MDLFNTLINENKNLLPKDGTVNYFGRILSKQKADDYLRYLLTSIQWKHDEAIVYGKHLLTKREVAWYGDENYDYAYSGVTRRALSWTNELLELKALVENKINEKFNSCLLNLYHSGEEGMAWHSDAEKDLKKNGTIASLSFGAERKFSLKHKHTKEKLSFALAHGSLLIMKDETQTHWLHSLPKMRKVHQPRINLTFRTIIR
ncbi:alpha-ketoglutarate-dependent dioxygenase AlkB [Prolixibacter sp. NT017]|uniref:alpha-ketoglutarate-dependent dioxygenase AlkB family protein n=1 Tax=Prolixibacter sp. NT017 TaxID=2652390 RepID=UPI0012838C17|nr:alpha-ketoglutarate-dependent dioxygenase AlkB [Prolixibacter sp. NT017]GET23931.1 DNA methylase [Prolixibacter sp. NT017]